MEQNSNRQTLTTVNRIFDNPTSPGQRMPKYV